MTIFKKLSMAVIVTSAVMSATFAQTSVTGAGASFPAPVYAKWAHEFNKETGIKVNYQSIGSSAGVKQIEAKTVDFGASDAPLTDEALNEKGLFQFPTVTGGVVLAINVEGIKTNELVLNGQVLGDIFLGKIKKWNDPAIQALNKSLKLPDQNITVVRRADGSGTSFIFTTYLSKVNAEWKEKIGAGSTVNWIASSLGGKGNDGVSAFVQRIAGSIGYVEYAYAKQNNLSYTKLVSHDGEVLSPSAASFSAAAAKVNWDQSFAQDLTDREGKNAWPIASTTFILVYKEQPDAKKFDAIKSFVNWGWSSKGQEIVNQLDYAPLPENVVKLIQTRLDSLSK